MYNNSDVSSSLIIFGDEYVSYQHASLPDVRDIDEPSDVCDGRRELPV